MWNPDRYERFRDERSRPFFDLLDLVRPKPDMRVVDLGCGTGALTRAMHERLAAKETLAIDSSAEMLARTAEHAVSGLRFERGDAGAFEADGDRDLIFSNAALQWIEGHDALFARLARALAPAGQLAVQMPANVDHPTHVVATALASEEPFAACVAGKIRSSWPVLAPEAYATLLYDLGFEPQHVRLQVYAHELASRDDVVTWVEGTLLTEYQAALPAELWPMFLTRYRAALLPQLKDTRPYLYPFKRILLWAQKRR